MKKAHWLINVLKLIGRNINNQAVLL